ncbi:sensor histidine kinase [Mucilaginibacter sp. AK015]|uniref:sensor histidine kinase n=1 Tax=Mucilaginibacter sp. AK015 TaxID=2723072 RepID=UPI00161AA401|nr:histidine kinase [Mucilaginibacter sp. AK015]MBB5396456.1 hydrogenase-4 membrane subunit HyfE [Mucilaginibacter sp. AK015]
MKYNKIEFWIATACFAIIFFSRLYQGLGQYNVADDSGYTGNQMLFYTLLPALAAIAVLYVAFLAVHFYVIPRFWRAKRYLAAGTIMLVVFVITGIIFSVQSYLGSWIYLQYGNADLSATRFVSRGFDIAAIAFFVYGIYLLLRRGVVYQYRLHSRRPTLASQITHEAIMLVGTWLLILLLLIATNVTGFFYTAGSFYLFALPFCFCIYFLNLYLMIPRYRKGGRHAGVVYALQLLGIAAFLGFIENAFLLQSVPSFSVDVYVLFYWFIPLVITVIVSWRVYIVNQEKYLELSALKTALGTSDATLQLLRSQINPHFLFNALNALYGTALVEGAARTSEGIQKLGDMMRFMLHENMRETIPLSRDIEYLRNYIDLQNLRIASSEGVTIKTEIADSDSRLQIVPMLLIPFIENAYKHGISFENPSFITINLQIKQDQLTLEVYNSRHGGTENNPDNDQPGIGLNNVKQRLKLLYPEKHVLQIRETKEDFFIHLTLHLS